MRFLKYGLIGLGIAAAGIVLFYQIFFRLPHPEYSGTIKIEGLTADVEVRFDDYGVPHIFAQTDEDLYFAQGYITARERMFQMDLNIGYADVEGNIGYQYIASPPIRKNGNGVLHPGSFYGRPQALPETHAEICYNRIIVMGVNTNIRFDIHDLE